MFSDTGAILMPTSTALTLRPYQEECVERVLEAYHQNRYGEATLVLPTGCHRAGQGILLYDGTIKLVEDIQVGDLLMGPDSTPRRVLALCRGHEEMYEIRPTKGDSWIVNKGHKLSLVRTKERTGARGAYPSTRGDMLCDVHVSDWLTWSAYKKHVHKLFRVGVDFPQRELLPIHPYLLGVLLGDGELSIEKRIHITSVDEPVVREVERILSNYGMHLHLRKQEHRAPSYALVGRIGKGNVNAKHRIVKHTLRNLGLFPIRCEDRFIPHIYKTAPRQDRRELLAGLIDTDGYCYETMFEYVSKSQYLANDVLFVARSLGLAAYKTPKVSSANNSLI